MIKRLILTTSIAVLLQPMLSLAEDPIPAQPITVETSIGNEQSDFFLSRDKKDNYKMTFSSNVKTLTNKKGAFDQRAMYVQRIGVNGLNGIGTFFTVARSAPLAKLTTFSIPAGDTLDTFLYNDNSENDQTQSGLPEEFFHVPTHGVYLATGGGKPALVKAVTGDFGGMALQNPGFTANDTDHNEAFRLTLEATDTKHGAEPYISQGPSSTTALLDDLNAGSGSSNPRSFITGPQLGTAENIAYFIADGADGPEIYQTSVNTSNPKKATYGANEVLGVDESAALNSSEGLLFVTTSDQFSVDQLYVEDGNGDFDEVTGAGTNPEDFTPQLSGLDTTTDGTGYSSVDSSSRRRFTVYYSTNGTAGFTDSTGDFTNPTDIICTVNDFFYNADIEAVGNYFVQDPVGDSDAILYVTDSDNFYLQNAREETFVHDDEGGGVLYFVADEAGNGGASGLLYMIDPNANGAPVAEKVKTNHNNPVVGAHNLRSIVSSTLGVFRLYFTAPVNTDENNEYLPLDKHNNVIEADFGTKPWVTNESP